MLCIAMKKGYEKIVELAKENSFFLQKAFDLNKGKGILVQCKLYEKHGEQYDYQVYMTGI